MRDAGRKRRAVGAALAAAAGLAGWGWLHRTADGPSVAVGRAPPTSGFFAHALSIVGAPEPASAEAAPALQEVHAAEERQLCGGAWVKVGADGNVAEEAFGGAEAEALRERTLARLRASPDEYARAVAVWLSERDPAAWVPLALGTRDPKVYALAAQGCAGLADAASACRLLSPAQWARLDPGNAAPWLLALDAASARHDRAAVDEALFQIGRAQRNERYLGKQALPVLSALPEDPGSLFASLSVMVQVAGRSMATAISGLQSVTRACTGAPVADANRRQLCASVAEVMAERSDDLVSRSIGASVADSLTGSSDRRNLWRVQLEAWTASRSDSVGVDPFECKSVRRSIGRLHDMASLGEADAMSRWVEASPLTSREWRERATAFGARSAARDAASASAPAAASAASAPG